MGTKGCDVHFASEVTGMTSLLFAAHGGHKHVLRYLIETLECDLHHRSINGGIVNLICRGRHLEVLTCMVDYSAKLRDVVRRGMRA